MQTVELKYQEPFEIEVRVYDVTVDGSDVEFDIEVDDDNDLRIELDEDSFEQVAIKYFRDRNNDDELKDMFGI